MKKIAFMLVVLVVLLSVMPVRAMETLTYSGTADSQAPYVAYFTTLRAGDVTAEVIWTPKKSQKVFYQLARYTDPNNPLGSRDDYYKCIMSSYLINMPPAGDWTCNLTNAPVGYYLVEFRPYSGSDFVTYFVTAETNP